MATAASGTNPPRLYTPDEALEYFGGKISRHNIYAALNSGSMSHIRVGRRILIREEALEAWLQGLTVKAI